MAEDRVGQCANILCRDGEPPGQDCPGLRPQDDVLGGARPGAPGEPVFDKTRRVFLLRPSGAHQVHRVINHVLAGGHLPHELLDPEDVAPLEDRLNVALDRLRGGQNDLSLFIPRGVTDVDGKHEPVELGFRQRIGSFLLDRVLRGHHEERQVERIGLARTGHLVLLHGLKQGGLGLGRRPVDLVGQDDVRKDRPALNRK